MGMIDKKIYRMGGKIIGGVAEVTVIFTDGSVYYFKGEMATLLPIRRDA